jgi:large repetitive protein
VAITRNGRWASADNTVVTVDEEGIVTAEALGSTTVTVTCGGLDASQEVAVVKVAGIRIVDPLAGGLLLEGEVRQLELYRRFSDGELDDEDIAGQASWSITAGSSIANIDDSGQLTMASSFIGYGADAIRVRAQFNGDEVEVELPIR